MSVPGVCVCVCVCWRLDCLGFRSLLASQQRLPALIECTRRQLADDIEEVFRPRSNCRGGHAPVCVGGTCSQERCNESQKCGGTQTPLPPRLVCVNRGRSSEESRDPTSQSSAAVLQCQVRVPLPTRQCSRGLWKPESTQGRGIYRRPRRVASDSQENLDQMDKSK